MGVWVFPFRNLYLLFTNTPVSPPKRSFSSSPFLRFLKGSLLQLKSCYRFDQLKFLTLVNTDQYTVFCHLNHGTDFLVALLAYYLFFPLSKFSQINWLKTAFCVVLFNLSVMVVFCGGWHFVTYSSKRFRVLTASFPFLLFLFWSAFSFWF